MACTTKSKFVDQLRFLASGQDDPQSAALANAADEIDRLREFASGLACDCEGEQCKVYGEDYLRFDCGYRKARTALGEDK